MDINRTRLLGLLQRIAVTDQNDGIQIPDCQRVARFLFIPKGKALEHADIAGDCSFGSIGLQILQPVGDRFGSIRRQWCEMVAQFSPCAHDNPQNCFFIIFLVASKPLTTTA